MKQNEKREKKLKFWKYQNEVDLLPSFCEMKIEKIKK